MGNLEDFVAVAREFSDWCLSPPVDEAQEVRRVLSLLTQLHGLALSLRYPDDMNYDLERPGPSDDMWRTVYRRACALPFNYYWTVSDPRELPSEEPEAGDLADDIADIFRDLSEGLALHADGHVREAEWSFLFSFRSHWGRHAASAIHALHCWCADTDGW